MSLRGVIGAPTRYCVLVGLNSIKILTFNKINNIILAFYDELLKHPYGCFCFGEIKLQRMNVLFLCHCEERSDVAISRKGNND